MGYVADATGQPRDLFPSAGFAKGQSGWGRRRELFVPHLKKRFDLAAVEKRSIATKILGMRYAPL